MCVDYVRRKLQPLISSAHPQSSLAATRKTAFLLFFGGCKGRCWGVPTPPEHACLCADCHTLITSCAPLERIQCGAQAFTLGGMRPTFVSFWTPRNFAPSRVHILPAQNSESPIDLLDEGGYVQTRLLTGEMCVLTMCRDTLGNDPKDYSFSLCCNNDV